MQRCYITDEFLSLRHQSRATVLSSVMVRHLLHQLTLSQILQILGKFGQLPQIRLPDSSERITRVQCFLFNYDFLKSVEVMNGPDGEGEIGE